MMNRELIIQIKWLFFVLIISFVLVVCFKSGAFIRSAAIEETQNTFLGLNFFLEIVIFTLFNVFVVFGIKGFFEMFSRKIANSIILISGLSLLLVNLILLIQIIFQD